MRSCGETVYFVRLRSESLGSRLPAALARTGDVAYLYLVSACLAEEPGFEEANLAVPCLGPAGPGTYFMRAWFSEPRLLKLAETAGWEGRPGRIRVPRIPYAARTWAWPPRRPLGGGVEGAFELSLSLGVECPPPEGMLRVYGVRGGIPTVELHPRERVLGSWAAAAELRLIGELAGLVGVHQVLGGGVVEIGIELGGYG